MLDDYKEEPVRKLSSIFQRSYRSEHSTIFCESEDDSALAVVNVNIEYDLRKIIDDSL